LDGAAPRSRLNIDHEDAQAAPGRKRWPSAFAVPTLGFGLA